MVMVGRDEDRVRPRLPAIDVERVAVDDARDCGRKGRVEVDRLSRRSRHSRVHVKAVARRVQVMLEDRSADRNAGAVGSGRGVRGLTRAGARWGSVGCRGVGTCLTALPDGR